MVLRRSRRLRCPDVCARHGLPAIVWRIAAGANGNTKLSQDRTQVTIHEPSEPFARQWHEHNG